MNRRTFVCAFGSSIAATATMAGTPGAVDVARREAPLMPELDIVDPHHHMVFSAAREGRPAQRYLLSDYVKDIAESGHRVTNTVAVQDFRMYRQDARPDLQPIGETEFLNGIAAMSASGEFGPVRVAAGIVGYASLRLGHNIREVLDSHQRTAGTRFKGIRDSCAWDAYPVLGKPLDPARRDLFSDPKSTTALRILASMGLTLDTWCFHPQIRTVAAAVQLVPELTVVLNHLGSPLAIGPYAGREKEIFREWSASIWEAAKVPNLNVKLGGLGMYFSSPSIAGRTPAATSTELARLWEPYMETCIDAFGVGRCMFESNFPPEAVAGSYGTIWNTFKRIAKGASESDRTELFSGTAKRIYRLT